MSENARNELRVDQSALKPLNALGWVGVERDMAEVRALREHLSANNVIRGLEGLGPSEVECAARFFYRAVSW